MGDAEDALPTTRSAEKRWTSAIRKRLPQWVTEQALPIVSARLREMGVPAEAVAEGEKILVGYDATATGTGYVRPTVMLEFGARSTGEPCASFDIACDAAEFVDGVVFPQATARVMRAERTFWEKATVAGVGPIELAASTVARGAVPLQVAQVRPRRAGADLVANDARLHHDPALANAALRRLPLKRLSDLLAAPDPRAPALFRRATSARAAAHLRGCDRPAVGLRRRAEDLGDEARRPCGRTAAGITDAAGTEAKFGVGESHGQDGHKRSRAAGVG